METQTTAELNAKLNADSRKHQMYTPIEEATIGEALRHRKNEPVSEVADRLSRVLHRPKTGIENKIWRMTNIKSSVSRKFEFTGPAATEASPKLAEPISFIAPKKAIDLLKAHVQIQLGGFKWEGTPAKIVIKADHFNIYF